MALGTVLSMAGDGGIVPERVGPGIVAGASFQWLKIPCILTIRGTWSRCT